MSRRFRDLRYNQLPGYVVEAARSAGAQAEFLAIEQDGAVIGYAALRKKRLPLAGGGLAYLHRGPACDAGEGDDPARLALCVEAVTRLYRGSGFLLRACGPGWEECADGAGDMFRRLGFRPARFVPGQTMVIDLAPPLDTLRRNLDQKWRTDLNRAQRSGLRVVRSAAPQDILRLEPLLSGLAAKKGFRTVQDVAFFAAVAATDPQGETVVVHLAWDGDVLLGGHIGAYCGDTAVYLLGATSDAGRDARVSFLLQWAVIEYARERGFAFYELGGTDPHGNPDVYRFKKRMGGQEVTHTTQWEKPLGLLSPALVSVAERIRSRIVRS